MPERKTCYYELLGVEELATDRELTKAYRKQALKLHPDKNTHRSEAAAEEFKEVQNAYAVLSDENERAWYDAHKEQILSGNTDGGNNAPDEVNIFEYSGTSCYRGYGDDEGGFFSVYRELFSTIVKEDGKYSKYPVPPPAFGNSVSTYSAVQEFYGFWQSYSSKKTFAWKDEYKPSDFPDRFQRRAAERHNEKERASARSEYNQALRFVVNFVKRHDPRVKAEQDRLDQIREEKERQRDMQQGEAAKKRKAEREQELLEAAEEEDEWAEQAEERERLRVEQMELLEAAAAAKRAEEEAERQQEQELAAAKAQCLKCEACKKSFKTDKLMDEHVGSAKHKNKVKQLVGKGELPKGWKPGMSMDPNAAAEEDKGEGASASSSGSDDDGDAAPSAAAAATDKPKTNAKGPAETGGDPPAGDDETQTSSSTRGKKGKAGKNSGKNVVDSDNDADDVTTSRAPADVKPSGASKKKKGNKKGAKKGRGGGDEDSDDDAAVVDPLAAEVAKTMAAAVKNQKQRAKEEKQARREAGVRSGAKSKKKGKNAIASSDDDDDDESGSDEEAATMKPKKGGGFAALNKRR